MRFPVLMIYLLSIVFAACLSCNQSGSSAKKTVTVERQRQRPRKMSITSPKNNEKQPLYSDIRLSVKLQSGADAVDSLRWLINGKWLKTNKGEDVIWTTSEQTTGTYRIEAIAYYSTGLFDMAAVSIVLTAPAAPKQYTYKLIQTYPHDANAYTQGLLFDDGFLYESTGQKGESTVRKVNLHTGEIVQKIDIPAEMFGEGLALVDDNLFQLTWQDRVAFVYQKSDFKLLKRINYNMSEGWGLTYDGAYLIMTDGSATLYFLEKENMTEIRRLEVCDNKGTVQYLNELEYINGELWANVYYTEDILRIDPNTGIVTGRINMTGLLKSNDIKSGHTNVLNGIAYDQATGKIYVTGKNWPKLFEIQVLARSE